MNEYKLIKPQKPSKFNEQVEVTNQILQQQSQYQMGNDFDFCEEEVKPKVEPQKEKEKGILDEITKMIQEVQSLRNENAKLKDENSRLRGRI